MRCWVADTGEVSCAEFVDTVCNLSESLMRRQDCMLRDLEDLMQRAGVYT